MCDKYNIILMTQRIEKNFLSNRDLNSIKNDCFVEGAYNPYGPTESLRAYGETSNALYVPFAYAKERFNASPNKDTNFPKTNYKFHSKKFPFRTDGGRDQEVVFNEAKKLLKVNRSVMLSLHCGFGKCLAKNTPILMYDGSLKMVQHVRVGDLLMGDDSTPRKVLSLARGVEEMYDITNQYGDKYTVNESHILSLKYDNKVVDIPLTEYLRRDDSEKFYGYRTAVEFEKVPIAQKPYKLGLTLRDYIPLHYKVNSRKIRLKVLAGIIDRNDGLVIKGSTTFLTDVQFLARSLGLKAIIRGKIALVSGDLKEVPTKKRVFQSFGDESLETKISVRSIGLGEYYGFSIDGNRRFVLGDFTVTHNTYTGIRIAHAAGLKCAVLAHRDKLFEQWQESIEKFTTAKVQIVGTDGVLDPEADFYIFNIAFVHKKWSKQKKGWVPVKLGKYKDIIGSLIVDEAHVACAAEMSRSLLYFNPRIAIALTATPHRKDGMDKALELYFGKYAKTQIVRIAKHPFTIYRYPTGIKPIFTYNVFGKKDWNSVIKYLVESEERNKKIISVVEKFPYHTIIILTSRKAHCKILSEMLTEKGISNSIYVGTSKDYDKKARVLLTTYSKSGVGFDDSRLDMEIIACSVTEVEQYAGRLRYDEGKELVIVDFVDDDANCKNHWQQRRKWYISRNGTIKHYHREFPDRPRNATKKQTPTKDPDDKKPKRLARRI